MAIVAHVGGVKDKYLATLSDGQRLEAGDLIVLARTLYRRGVASEAVDFGLRAGHRLLTSGQQVALYAEIRRLERECREKRLTWRDAQGPGGWAPVVDGGRGPGETPGDLAFELHALSQWPR